MTNLAADATSTHTWHPWSHPHGIVGLPDSGSKTPEQKYVSITESLVAYLMVAVCMHEGHLGQQGLKQAAPGVPLGLVCR
jgi:hypothetical protein